MEIHLDPTRTPFNLDHTLSCGQTFRWEKKDAYWTGVVNQTAIKIQQRGTVLQFKASSNKLHKDFLWHYFRLDDDLPKIYSKITKDNHIKAAINQFHGLRLVRQEPWECLTSYICATNKNIPAIKQMILNLCTRFGQPIQFEAEQFYTFPKPHALARTSLHELKLCKLGYRAERVRKTAKLVAQGNFDLEALKTTPYEKAKHELLKLPGVGHKVADCILLFSLDKLEAFPIDVWMKRIITEHYSQHFEPEFITKIRTKHSLSPREYQTIYTFGKKYLGNHLGYAQEYLYHHKRCQTG